MEIPQLDAERSSAVKYLNDFQIRYAVADSRESGLELVEALTQSGWTISQELDLDNSYLWDLSGQEWDAAVSAQTGEGGNETVLYTLSPAE